MSKGSKKTVQVETADLRPRRDYYCPDLGLSVQASSQDEANSRIEEIKEERLRQHKLEQERTSEQSSPDKAE